MAFLHGIEIVEIDDGVRPIQTVKSSIIGFVGTAPDADETIYPFDRPVLVTGPRMAKDLGEGGTLLDAWTAAYSQGVNAIIVVRVDGGADETTATAAVAGEAASATGLWALLAAENLLGLTPRILAAPGWTSSPPGAEGNPVTQGLLSVADRLRAVVIADGPNATEADALAYRENYGSARLYIVDPAVRVWDAADRTHVTQPASGFVAGALSASDAERGFWWSPSNRVLKGVTGAARPVDWAISDPDTEANRLNEAGIATIVRKNGFRLWGNRAAGETSDTLWSFLSVRRTADMVYESVEAALLWAMDRPFSEQLLRDIRDSVQAYLDELVARRAILGGRVWLDPELNTETTMKAGQLYINFDLEPPAPLERLTLQAHRNGTYYEELLLSVSGNQQ